MKEIKIMRTERNLKILADFAATLKGRELMVEVGSYAGQSANVFAPMVGKLICVDPWSGRDDVMAAFIRNTIHIHNLGMLREESVSAASGFADGSIDVVYIDAAHDYANVKADILAWMPKVKAGGVFCGHDYGPHAPGVIQAVDELIGKPSKVWGETSWVR